MNKTYVKMLLSDNGTTVKTKVKFILTTEFRK